MAQPTVPFAKKRQRHGQNREADGTTDRAFCKKASKARSKPEQRGRPRPCLLQKNGKGTVKTGAKQACPTVPFAKKRQRHGQNRSEAVAPDRAFYKKASKARSKPRGRGHPPPPNVAPDHASCKKHAQPRSPQKDSATTPPWSPPPQMNSVIAPHPALIANRPFHTDTERYTCILHNLNKKALLVLT